MSLDKWFKEKWVDIGSKKKDGTFAKCGRSKQKADAITKNTFTFDANKNKIKIY